MASITLNQKGQSSIYASVSVKSKLLLQKGPDTLEVIWDSTHFQVEINLVR
jgi:hypothetical protein